MVFTFLNIKPIIDHIAAVGNNKSGTVTYEVWGREGDEGPWGLQIQTRKQNFSDHGITPGQYYEYKVRAVARPTTLTSRTPTSSTECR